MGDKSRQVGHPRRGVNGFYNAISLEALELLRNAVPQSQGNPPKGKAKAEKEVKAHKCEAAHGCRGVTNWECRGEEGHSGHPCKRGTWKRTLGGGLWCALAPPGHVTVQSSQLEQTGTI
ncbi:hypothetical protein DPEC_G00017130 [Dallia pectoralis]|uniref:Uncharacterized protein n=1 Tax=Dallia pectoralis TaxID=75939 RepID=A0ACC2HF42_DALPE|nr:hypothetical protein DPEC_G00017130 [Dallia pectoralis]